MNTITIVAKNQPGVLKAVTAALFDANINIEFMHADTSVVKDDATEVVIKSHDDLSAVAEKIRSVSGIVAVNV